MGGVNKKNRYWNIARNIDNRRMSRTKCTEYLFYVVSISKCMLGYIPDWSRVRCISQWPVIQLWYLGHFASMREGHDRRATPLGTHAADLSTLDGFEGSRVSTAQAWLDGPEQREGPFSPAFIELPKRNCDMRQMALST